MNHEGIISSGRRMLLKDPSTQDQIKQVVSGIKARYAQDAKGANILARLRLWLRMRKDVRAAIDKIAPSRGCYLKK
jgi:hypothetical protein